MSDTVIDTCCLTNVSVTGDLGGVLSRTKLTWHIPPAVAAEAVFTRVREANGRVVRQRVDLVPFLATGLLRSCALAEGAETALYVDLAGELSDGEAMALAIPTCRGWKVATDDHKARRRAAELGAGIITTPEIMRLWAENGGFEQPAVRAALLNIQTLARFVPSTDFPDYEWWVGTVGTEL